jgi:hypothetical protein
MDGSAVVVAVTESDATLTRTFNPIKRQKTVG